MEQDALRQLYSELRRRLREIDWINTPYLQMLMDTKDEWLRYQEQLKSIPHQLAAGEIEPPKLINGTLHFAWPRVPSDSVSSWEKMARFSERECPKISKKKNK